VRTIKGATASPKPRAMALVHARGSVWGALIFQNMFKKEQ
jgi:hypothetical protein